MLRLHFEIRLLSDYHIGSGYGIGEAVDSALQRDPDGQPVIRGTAVVGLLRDGLRRLLNSTPVLTRHFQGHRDRESARTDQDQSAVAVYCTDADCPLCRLLGTPARPKPWSFSTARPVGAAGPAKRMDWPTGNLVTRVQVSPLTRRAEDAHLFVQEEGGAGLVFRFTAECEDGFPGAQRDAALLVAACRMVRHLGSTRRRGRGGCLWSLVQSEGGWPDAGSSAEDADLTRLALADFERWWLAGQPAESVQTATRPCPDLGAGTGGPLRFRVLVRSNEPILVAERPAAGNLYRGLDQISGGTLWGALAARAARHLGLGRSGCDPRAHALFYDLFFGGALRTSPLFPAAWPSGTTLLWPRFPAPLDLLTCKYVPGFPGARPPGHHTIGAAVVPALPDQCPECGGPLEARPGLLTLKPRGGSEPAEIPVQEELHPRIDPVTQQVNRGDLFGYRALAAGQYFLGEIWLCDRAALDLLAELADLHAIDWGEDQMPTQADRMRLGKASRRGYGGASLWLTALAESGPPFCAGVALAERVSASAAGEILLTLTLVSDAVLPDPWGRAYGSLADPWLLADLFGGLPCTVEALGAYCRPREIDGFANHAGLPRWRDLAIAAGSAVGLRLVPRPGAADWLPQVLAHLDGMEREGIGLRREEGCGRLVFNHPVYSNYSRARTIPGVEIPVPMEITEPTGPDAQRERLIRRWSEELDRHFGERSRRAAFRHENWLGVARWLDARAHQGVDALLGTDRRRGLIAGLGKATALHPKRPDKHNWFEEDGKAGVEALETLLRKLAKLPEWTGLDEPSQRQALEPGLIRMLAGRIAAAAPEVAGETR